MGCCLGGDPVTDDELKSKRKSTQQICERFREDASNNENVDIYQMCAIVSNIGDDACVKWWYYFKALVCFTFQTTMLGLMVYQFTHMNGRDEWEEDDDTEQFSFASSSTIIPVEDTYDDKWDTHWNKMTRSIAFCASLYISVSIWNWMWDLEHQGLYRIERTFINCPHYVSHAWITVGLFANFFTLFFSLIGSNLLIYWAESALDVILNCVAIFFLLQIDNEMIGLSDYENIKRWMENQEQRASSGSVCSSTKSRKISDPTQAAIQLADDKSNTQDTVPSNDGSKDSQTKPVIAVVAMTTDTNDRKDEEDDVDVEQEIEEEETEHKSDRDEEGEDSKIEEMIKRVETMERKMCIGGGERCKCGWGCESYEHQVTCYTKCGCYSLCILMVITLVSAACAPFVIIGIWDKY